MMSPADVETFLRDHWNPIGFDDSLPRDEYEHYATALYQIIVDAPTKADALTRAASYLTYARTVTIGQGTLWGRSASAEAVMVKDAEIAKRLIERLR